MLTASLPQRPASPAGARRSTLGPRAVPSSTFEEGLSAYGLRERDLDPRALTVREGETAFLTTGEGSLAAPRMIQTSDIDLFKAWVGAPDAAFRSGLAPILSQDVPERAWVRGGRFDPSALDPQEIADLERAARTYFFGPSYLVASYREAILKVYAPFELAVYSAHSIEIEPGATLRVEGKPALLRFHRLTLRAPGQVIFHAPFKLVADELVKVPAR